MNIFISGADRGFGFGLTKKMLERGYTVFAGQYLPEWTELQNLKQQFAHTLHLIPLDVGSDESVEQAVVIISGLTEQLDVLISNAAIRGWNPEDHADFTDTTMMMEVYNVNTLGSVRLFERCLPLLKKGSERKVCFVSSEAGSIGDCWRDGFFWYAMSKAALNRYARVMFNRHRKEDFKFRLYHPGWIQSYMSGKVNEAAAYTPDESAVFAMDYFFDQVVNEDQFVLHSYDGTDLSF